ncbi:hypothetical protein D3C78_1417190 [compost metagenome]
MPHHVLRQAAGVGQVDGKGLAALVDRDGVGVELHLVVALDIDRAFSGQKRRTEQTEQGYGSEFTEHTSLLGRLGGESSTGDCHSDSRVPFI